ncbi:hypothetical protein BGZ80_006433, partial [Entomortierella chlamydospora]
MSSMKRSRNAAGLVLLEAVEWGVDAPNWDCNDEEEDAVAGDSYMEREEGEEEEEEGEGEEEGEEVDEDTDEDNGDGDADEECDVEG